MRRSRFRSTAALLVLCALVLAACGEEEGGDEGAQPGAATTTTARLTGEPVKLSVITNVENRTVSSRPELFTAARAAANEVNARGGINGRPLEIVTCDTRGDPNQSATCARQAVDQGVVAGVGHYNITSATSVPVFEAAGVANIGAFPLSAPDFTSKASFPVISGAAIALAGLGDLLAGQGARGIHVVYTDVPIAARAVAAIDMALADEQAKTVGKTPVPPGTPDLSPQVTAAGRGSDAILVGMSDVDTPRFLQTAKQLGLNQRMAVASTAVDPTVVRSLGPAAEGVYVVGFFPPPTADVPGVKRFVREMDAVDRQAVKNDPSLNTWLAVQVFASAAKGLPLVDRASVLDAMGKIQNLDLEGLVPPYSTTRELPFPGQNRVFNPTVTFNQIKDGRITQLQPGFVTPLKPPGT